MEQFGSRQRGRKVYCLRMKAIRRDDDEVCDSDGKANDGAGDQN